MNVTSPYVPTSTQLNEAMRFTNFSADLHIAYDRPASDLVGHDQWKVTQSFRFYLEPSANPRWAYVPAGFLTDGATVARPFWWLIPPWGSYGQAAVLHDLLCETRTVFHDGLPVTITRAECDKIFNEAMKATKVNPVIRTLMYAAVRIYGFFRREPDYKRIAKKRPLEEDYQRAYGTYREPAAILGQIARSAYAKRQVERQQVQ